MNSKAIDNILPVAPGIFTPPPYENMPPKLLGGFCETCKRHYFPRPRYCKTCLREVEQTVLGSTGKLYSYTVVRTRPPFGLPQPYAVGFVDLTGSDLRIYSLLDPSAIGQFRIGMPVCLAVGSLGHDGKGNSCLRPFFVPSIG